MVPVSSIHAMDIRRAFLHFCMMQGLKDLNTQSGGAPKDLGASRDPERKPPLHTHTHSEESFILVTCVTACDGSRTLRERATWNRIESENYLLAYLIFTLASPLVNAEGFGWEWFCNLCLTRKVIKRVCTHTPTRARTRCCAGEFLLLPALRHHPHEMESVHSLCCCFVAHQLCLRITDSHAEKDMSIFKDFILLLSLMWLGCCPGLITHSGHHD